MDVYMVDGLYAKDVANRTNISNATSNLAEFGILALNSPLQFIHSRIILCDSPWV